VSEVRAKGVKRVVREADLVLGTPISPMLCQRLKSSEKMIKKMGKVAVEPKIDGTRAQIHYKRQGKDWVVRSFTRNLEETTAMFPELVEMGKHVTADELVLDSEAVGFDPHTQKMMSFQMTITRKRKHGVADQASKVPLKFYVFDVMLVDGKSLVDKSYEERREMLRKVVKDDELLVVDDYWITDDPEVIDAKHEELLGQGLEGVVVKKLGSRYVPGRTGWRWVKMKEVEASHAKLADTVDCVVMGYYKGKGKRTEFGVGAFLAGIMKDEKIVTVTKVGTGLTDEQFRELKKRLDWLVVDKKPKGYEVDKNLEPDVWVEPGLVVELAADEVTRSPIHTAGVALRFPRLIKFRDDKSVGETTSVEELKGL
jgi:DNA ligase-1